MFIVGTEKVMGANHEHLEIFLDDDGAALVR